MHVPDAIAERLGDRRLVPATDGQSGARVFRAGDDLFLKVGEGGAANLVSREAARLRWLDGRALAPEIVMAREEPGRSWLLTTALHGVSALDHIKGDRSGRLVPTAEAIAAFLIRLHALPADECPFDSSMAAWLPEVRRLVADGLVDVDDFDDEHEGWSADAVLAKVENLSAFAAGRVVVHGDFSLGNIIIGNDGQVAGCIDVGRLGVGDPYRDIFIGWRDLGGFGGDAQAAFLAALGIDHLSESRRELHRALDELF